MRKSMLQFWVALGLVFLLFLDGSLDYLFQGHFLVYPDMMQSRLVVLAVVMLVFFLPKWQHQLVTLMVIGFLFDLFYTGILGIYIFLLPLIWLFTTYIEGFFQATLPAIGAIYLIDLTVLEIMTYMLNSFMGLTNMGVATFIPSVLGMTLLLNIMLFVILYFPLRGLLLKLEMITV